MAGRRRQQQFRQVLRFDSTSPAERTQRQRGQRGVGLEEEPESPGERALKRRGLRLEECALFHCRDCRAVLGDSLSLCAQEERGRVQLLACLKVTNDVVVEDSLKVCIEGDLIGCTYYALHCRSCGQGVGVQIYCSRALAHLRGLFCFFKDKILCYLLKLKP